jgi:hypothetical protein
VHVKLSTQVYHTSQHARAGYRVNFGRTGSLLPFALLRLNLCCKLVATAHPASDANAYAEHACTYACMESPTTGNKSRHCKGKKHRPGALASHLCDGCGGSRWWLPCACSSTVPPQPWRSHVEVCSASGTHPWSRRPHALRARRRW